MTQLKKGVSEGMGPSQDEGPVVQQHGWSPASGIGLTREPEDIQALLSGSLQLESKAWTCPQGPRSEGDTALSSGSPGS